MGVKMDAIEEIKKRILDLEGHKDKLSELIPWKETQAPLLEKELAGVKAELHDLRQQLEAVTKHAAPAPAPTPAPDPREEEGYIGFFS